MATKIVHSVGNLVRAKEDIQISGFDRDAVIKVGTIGIVEAAMDRARKRVVCFESDDPYGITVPVHLSKIAAYA